MSNVVGKFGKTIYKKASEYYAFVGNVDLGKFNTHAEAAHAQTIYLYGRSRSKPLSPRAKLKAIRERLEEEWRERRRLKEMRRRLADLEFRLAAFVPHRTHPK